MNSNVHLSFLNRVKGGLFPSRFRWLFFLGAIVGLLSLALFWRPIQQNCLTYLLLQSDGPSPEVLSDHLKSASDPKALLKRLWQTERIPHRHFVLSYLARNLSIGQLAFGTLDPMILDATRDPDIETRELAFAALARAKHPRLRELALGQLDDIDPAARVLGLQTLRSIATASDVPTAIHLLGDSEPRVAVAAALVLRQVTGKDFGIRISQALPQFFGMGTNAPPPPDLNAIRQGVQKWRDWWGEHESEYPIERESAPVRGYSAKLATRGFSLEDSNGKLAHLSDYRGKVVLLAFWSPDTPVSLDAVSTLAMLQNDKPERLAVVGICVPPASSCGDEEEHASEHAHHHHVAAAPVSSDPERIREIALERKITYPMLLDSKGAVGLRFGAENLPTYVLIDAQGTVRRRFVGDRNKQVLDAMIDEASKATLDAKTARIQMDQP